MKHPICDGAYVHQGICSCVVECTDAQQKIYEVTLLQYKTKEDREPRKETSRCTIALRKVRLPTPNESRRAKCSFKNFDAKE